LYLRLTLTLTLWSVALIISAGLHWCGDRWPEPLPPSEPLALLLVLGQPVVLALWILLRSSETHDDGESAE